MNDAGMIEAVVQVGAEETPYLRCGRGPTVVVVLAPERAERRRLAEQYASGHRVIAPATDNCPALCGGEPATLEQWLQGLIDGLGLESPTVVLAPAFAHLAPRLQAVSSSSLDAVVVVALPAGS